MRSEGIPGGIVTQMSKTALAVGRRKKPVAAFAARKKRPLHRGNKWDCSRLNRAYFSVHSDRFLKCDKPDKIAGATYLAAKICFFVSSLRAEGLGMWFRVELFIRMDITILLAWISLCQLYE